MHSYLLCHDTDHSEFTLDSDKLLWWQVVVQEFESWQYEVVLL